MADTGNGLQEQIKALWHAGIVRHVYVRKDDHTPLDLPLLLVIAGGILAPWLLGIGVVVALLLGYRLEVLNLEAAVEEPAAETPPETVETPQAQVVPAPGPDAVPPEATEGGEPRG